MARAMSSAVPARPLELRWGTWASSSGRPGMRRSEGVSVTPAWIAFTVMPRRAAASLQRAGQRMRERING